MAWDKTLIAEGVLAPDLNNEIRANWEAIEAALTKELNFATGGEESLQGIHRQGSARCFAQATAPATRVDGTDFVSTDLGCLWIKTDDNKLYVLTATTPTWTSIESVTIATLLAATRTFAEIITFSKSPAFTLGIVGNNAYLQARNKADNGNINMIKINASNVPEVLVGAVLSASTAPGSDAAIPNKKYVDDQLTASIGQSSQAVGTSDISNTSGDWADMTDMSITITTKGGNVLLMFSASIKGDHNNSNWGIRFDEDDTARHRMKEGPFTYEGQDPQSCSMQYLCTSLAAGLHTFKVQWKDMAHGVLQSASADSTPRVFTAIELPS